MPLHQHITKKIENRLIEQAPFSHFIINDFLPIEIFQKLRSEIKKLVFEKHPCAFVNKERTVLYLTASNDNKYLKEFHDHINSQQFIDLICQHIVSKNTATKLKNKELFFEIQIIKDTYGYNIAPHCDTSENIVHKYLTLLLYFPDDAMNINYGTELYEQNKQDKRLMHIKKTVPYIPNLLFGFIPRANTTWHGRQPLNKNIIRHSVQVFLKQKAD